MNGQQVFPEGPDGKYFRLVDHAVSALVTSAIVTQQTKGHDCVPVELYEIIN